MNVSLSGLLMSPGINLTSGRLTRGAGEEPTGTEVSGRLGPATDIAEEATTAADEEETTTVDVVGAVTPDDPLGARLLVLLLLITKCKVAIDSHVNLNK